VAWQDATIHVATHALHYGTGIFEGIRAYETADGSAVYRLDEHMRRLYDSCRVYRMEPRWSIGELLAAVLETVRVNGFRSCYIRPLVYRGLDHLGLDPRPCPVDVSIIVWEWNAMFGAEGLEQGIDVGVSSWTRLAPNTLPAMAKATGNYANSGLIKMQAMLDGYGDAIALDERGLVSEGSGQNLFLVRDRVIYTPTITSSILQGITRDSVIVLARDLGYVVREVALPPGVPLHGGRGVLLRHSRGGHAHPLDRSHRRGVGGPGARDRGPPEAVFRFHYGRRPRHPSLAHAGPGPGRPLIRPGSPGRTVHSCPLAAGLLAPSRQLLHDGLQPCMSTTC
jgi:branched-chain amino acid aminotransferase